MAFCRLVGIKGQSLVAIGDRRILAVISIGDEDIGFVTQADGCIFLGIRIGDGQGVFLVVDGNFITIPFVAYLIGYAICCCM